MSPVNELIEQANGLHAAGDFDPAIRIYQQALAMIGPGDPMYPDYSSFHLVVGDMQQELGRLEDAAVSYRRVLESVPDHPDALASLQAIEKATQPAPAPGLLSRLFKR